MSNLTTTWTDDDGSGTVGTIINNSQLQAIYQNTGRADNHAVGGRLTLTSGTPVTVNDVTGATTLYYTPYTSDVIALFDGSANWVPVSFVETSIALGTLTNALPYDVFAFNNGGTLNLELLAWSNGTTRATALVYQNGVLVKSGVTTRRYLGSFYTTSATTTEDSVLKRVVWNNYNRRMRRLRVAESTSNWNYVTASYRQANGSASNQVDVMQGLAESMISLDALSTSLHTTTGTGVSTAIGEDSITAPAGLYGLPQSPATAVILEMQATIRTIPALGHHYYAWLEKGPGSGTSTWYGTNSSTQQAGMEGWFEA